MNKILKYKENKLYYIQNFVRMCFIQLGWKIIKLNCKHEEKKVVFENYQDRYIHYFCEDCRSDIYSDL